MKFVKIAGITTLVVVALAILGVTLAFAQKPAPTDTPWWNTMRGRLQGRGGPRGNWQSMQDMHNQMTQNGGMAAMREWMQQSGGIHTTVWNALAEKLGLTADALTAEINSGKTLAQITKDKGVSVQDLAATMEKSMKAALDQAVKDGKLTQAQVDLMLNHMAGRFEWMINNMGAGMFGPGPGGCNPRGPFFNDTSL